MNLIEEFEIHLSSSLINEFRSLKTPAAIQAYLDEIPYIAEELDRSPLRVITDHQGHCLDGGIFAALALHRLGFTPMILDLVPEPGLDDDHVLALYRIDGLWGCLAKSNYPVLRSREPVYRSLRELAMSYFDFYFNTERKRSLRAYTRPLHLETFKPDWLWSEAGLAEISRRLYKLIPVPLIPAPMASQLSPGDERTYRAASLGTDFHWAYGIRENS